MSEEVKTPEEQMNIPLPHTTEFEDGGNGKNATKIEVDMEKNAPFIKEYKERLDAVNDPILAKKIEEEFLAATGIPFDKAYEAMEKKVTVVINKEDGSVEVKKVDKDSEEAKSGKIVEPQKEDPKPEEPTTEEKDDPNDPAPKVIYRNKDDKSDAERVAEATDAAEVEDDEEAEDNKRLLEEVEKRLADAKANPETLKFTESEITELIKMGVMGDAESVRALADRFNQEIDEIIKNRDNPESEYSNQENLDKIIRQNLEVKISLQESIESAKQLTDPAFIQDLFNVRYPGYAEKGPAIIYELFLGYLKSRADDPKEREVLFNEMTSKDKIESIRKNVNKKIFRHMMTGSGVPYNHVSFINTMYELNRSHIGKALNLDLTPNPKDPDGTAKRRHAASPVLAVFSVLFMRFMYKKLTPDFERSKLQRKYLIGFILDSANPAALTQEKVDALDKIQDELWDYMVQLDADLAKYERDHFDSNGHRIKK